MHIVTIGNEHLGEVVNDRGLTGATRPIDTDE